MKRIHKKSQKTGTQKITVVLFATITVLSILIFIYGNRITKITTDQMQASGLDSQVGSAAAAVSSPVFTKVAHFVQTNSFPAGTTTTGHLATLESISTMTAEQASKMLDGENIDLPSNAAVIVAKEKGPFTLNTTIVPQGVSEPQFTYGIRVFDATTGNLLLVGAIN